MDTSPVIRCMAESKERAAWRWYCSGHIFLVFFLMPISADSAMSRDPKNQPHPDRRDFLKTAGAAAAGALLVPHLEALADTAGIAEFASAAHAGWTVRPFALTQV